ncbi:MAG: hypothetical protein M1835_000231 [Candelina submexicana]|nr:MAG: hypothetical protein M1835_000231 [Candelina submexicana]
MSAHQIPNLKSLRSSRGLGRGRGPGRGADEDHSSSQLGSAAAKDRIVQQTDSDASISRLSAVKLGYLEDPFSEIFVTQNKERRFPIINRGTFVRSTAIDTLVTKFLSANPSQKKQIISLGAGSDTRYFRLKSSSPPVSLVYHELDFSANTTRKIACIKQSQPLLSTIESDDRDLQPGITISEDGSGLYSDGYNIHPIDLRTLHPPEEGSETPPTLKNIDPNLPTLLISECCLIYLPPSSADSILRYFTSHLFPSSTPLSLLVYEPINPSDAFGRVMVTNLAARGIVLQTLKKYSSLERQKERMRVMGFRSGQGAADVDFIWEKWVSQEEKERVAGLEMLDEVEEWRMLARHYCVAWGWRNGAGDSADGFKAWQDVLGQEENV